jgi:hypothetical protein
VGVWWCGGPGRGLPLRSNIPRSALCATLDTYNFYFFAKRLTVRQILICLIPVNKNIYQTPNTTAQIG